MKPAALARMRRRVERHDGVAALNERIRVLAAAGSDIDAICDAVDRGPNYVRRIAAWRLK